MRPANGRFGQRVCWREFIVGQATVDPANLEESLMKRHRKLLSGLLAGAALQMLAVNVQASSIANAELSATGAAITLDQGPVVSDVLSTPTTTNGVATT